MVKCSVSLEESHVEGLMLECDLSWPSGKLQSL